MSTRQFGQLTNPSRRAFGQAGSLSVDSPSSMEVGQAVTSLADAQRGERNLYKRTYRGLRQRLRKGDMNAGLTAIELLHAGQEAGIQMSGIASADGANQVARDTLGNNLIGNQEMVDAASGITAPSAMERPTSPFLVGSTRGLEQSRTVAPPATTSLQTGPNDGGAAPMEVQGLPQAPVSPGITRQSPISDMDRGMINGKPTSEILGARQSSGPRGMINGIPTEQALGEVPAPVSSGDPALAEMAARGADLKVGLDLLARFDKGEVQEKDLHPDEIDRLNRAREFATAQKAKGLPVEGRSASALLDARKPRSQVASLFSR